jgi:hypothetical protein
MVYSQFMDGDIAEQIGFMNSAIGTQEITQTRPAAFVGVDVDFTNAIAIVIECPSFFS